MRITRSAPDAVPVHTSGERITNWQLGRITPIPSRVPDRWELVQLTSIARLESGHTPARNRPAYWTGKIPWISLHDSESLDVSEIHDTGLTVSEDGLANSSARLLPKGTVVFSRTATVGKCTIMGRAMATSQDFANYVCGDRLSNRYLMYLFRFMAPEWSRVMAGSTHNTIYMPVFQRLQILLPPLPEQEAIAGALSDVDALIEALEQLIAKKRDLKQAAMQELLTGSTRLPAFSTEWQTKTLAKFGPFLKGSGAPKSRATSGNIPCVRYGELYTRHSDHIRQFYSWISRDVAAGATRLKRGDILFAGSGETKAEIGKCAAFTHKIEAYAGGDIVILRTNDGDPRFLGYYLNTPPIARQKARRGHGDAVVHITATALSSIEVTIPEPAEQAAIATVLSDMDAEIDALESKLAKARQIKLGMMQQLLTGRVRLV